MPYAGERSEGKKGMVLKMKKIIIPTVIILILLLVTISTIVIIKVNKPKEEPKQEVVYEVPEELVEEENTLIGAATVEKHIPEEGLIPLDPTYQGYAVAGKIQIPKTGVDTPFFDGVTVEKMEIAPCLLYKTGNVNEPGNVLIVGHNYMNDTLFSNNKYLEIGDKIIITAMDGYIKEYTIYDKFITTAEDVSYIKRDTNGFPEISLQTCTDDEQERLILLAK